MKAGPCKVMISQNPGMLWVEQGEEIWETVEGEAGKACASCHNDAGDTMKGIAVRLSNL